MNLDVDIKRKATVRVSRKDLQKLLAENEQMAEQITALQTRLNELLEENRQLKQQVQEFLAEELENVPEDWGPGPGRSPDPNHPLPRTDIYFDGSNGLSRQRFGSNG